MKVKKQVIIILVIAIILVFMAGLFYLISNKYFNKEKLEDEKENDKSSLEGNVIETSCTYDNPIIPNGFKKVETEDASWELDENNKPKGWNEGLVIEDTDGNQFVWVPYNSKELKYSYINTDYEYFHQIIRHQGFYISRYEAGLPKDLADLKTNISEETNNIKAKPVSKKDAIPWNYISVSNAKYNAENMYEKNAFFSTTLPNQGIYDYIINYMFKTGEGQETEEYGNNLNTSFTFSGYYSNDDGKNYEYAENMTKKKGEKILLSTGAYKKNKKKNIYDFFGNLSEGYITKISEYNYIYAEKREEDYTENVTSLISLPKSYFYGPDFKIGFRVVLYLT